MYNQREIILLLTPNLPTSEVGRLSALCEKVAIDYDVRGWKEVDSQELGSENVRMNLIRTIYQTQFGFLGVIVEITQSLIDWSDGKLTFNNLSADDELFYQKYFNMLCSLNFEYLRPSQQIYFLSGHFFISTLASKLPLKQHISNYFARYSFTDILKKNAALLAGAISVNNTLIGTKTVAGLIIEYKQFSSGDIHNKANEFVDGQQMEVEEKKLIREVLNLYDEIASNIIWKKLDYFLGAHEKTEKNKPFNADKDYLKLLAANPDIGLWLQDYADIARWLGEKTEFFLRQVFGVLVKKIDLSNSKQLYLLLKLIASLPEKHAIVLGDVLVFHESDSKFHWNEEALSGVRVSETMK